MSPKSGTAGPIRTVPAFHLLRIHDAQGRVGEDRGMAGLGVDLMSTTVSGLGAVAVILAIRNEGLPPTFFVRISENTTSAAVRIAVGEPHPLAQSERVPPSVRRLGVGRRKVGHRGRDVGTLVAQQRVVQRAQDYSFAREPGQRPAGAVLYFAGTSAVLAMSARKDPASSGRAHRRSCPTAWRAAQSPARLLTAAIPECCGVRSKPDPLALARARCAERSDGLD